MIERAVLYKEIDKLPPKYFGEVYDFVGYLRSKAQKESPAVRKRMSEAEEIELINRNAEYLNREAMDVLEYQIPIFEDEDSE